MSDEATDPATMESLDMRDRYNAFIARHEVGWELLFGAVAILFVALARLLR